MHQATADDLVRRVDSLERQNRWYKRLNVFMLSLFLFVLFCAARQPFVDGVMIRDRDGRDRAGMWVDEQDKRHAVIEMIDDRGDIRYWTSLEPNGTIHSVYTDSRRRPRIDMGVDGNDRVFMRILDPQGNILRDLTQ